MLFKKFLISRIVLAFRENKIFINRLILDYAKTHDILYILDVGCGNGENTKIILKDLNNYHLYGLDMVDVCENKLLKYKKIDLESNKFPFESNKFDIVYSNQVIEHILNKDKLISECHRVLKNGGLFIISTENIASFDNLISLLFGQEPITQHTGNKFMTSFFFSPHFMEKVTEGNKFAHKNVCSYFGLIRLVKLNGFSAVKIKSFGNVFWLVEKILPIYNRIITVYGTK